MRLAIALANRLANFRQDVSRWGLARSLYMRLMIRNASWLNVSRAMERDLRKTFASHEAASGFSFRIADQEELTFASEDPQLDLPPDFLRRALLRGDICVGAFDGQQLVAYAWRSFRETPHSVGLVLRFSKRYRYAYKSFTRPEYRGRRLQERITPLADGLCIERGHTHGISFIETHNYPSLAMARHAVPVGFLGYVKVFGRVFTFRSPAVRRRGFGFHPAP